MTKWEDENSIAVREIKHVGEIQNKELREVSLYYRDKAMFNMYLTEGTEYIDYNAVELKVAEAIENGEIQLGDDYANNYYNQISKAMREDIKAFKESIKDLPPATNDMLDIVKEIGKQIKVKVTYNGIEVSLEDINPYNERCLEIKAYEKGKLISSIETDYTSSTFLVVPARNLPKDACPEVRVTVYLLNINSVVTFIKKGTLVNKILIFDEINDEKHYSELPLEDFTNWSSFDGILRSSC